MLTNNTFLGDMQEVGRLPILEKIPPEEMPNIFKQKATIVRPIDSTKPIVKLASENYKLKDYLNEKLEERPTFFSPENIAGPDLIFFIKFHNEQVIPVTVQLKL